jgi:hypothetical protein
VVALAQLSLLDHGIAPLHAALFEYQDRLVAASGWSRGGKTAALMSMLGRGADARSAEWTYLGPDGCVSVAEHKVRVRWTHLRAPGSARRLLAARTAARVRFTGKAGASIERSGDFIRALPLAGATLANAARRLGAAIEGRSFVDAPMPGQSADISVASSGRSHNRRLAAVLVLAGSAGGHAVRRLAPADLVGRLGVALEEEFRALAAAERRFLFASGERAGWSPDWPTRYRTGLADRLNGVEGWLVLHPDPPSLPALAETIVRTLP